MAYAPDLRRLRLDGDAARLPELPKDIWLSILAAVDSDNPCDQVAQQCSVKQEWAAWCRDGTVYDLVNRALGWYGEYDSWQELVQQFLRGSRRGRVWHREQGNGMTPKRWFQHVCRDRREIVNLLVRQEDHLYEFRNKHNSPAQQHDAHAAMETVVNQLRVLMIRHARINDDQPPLPYGSALCKFAVAIDGNLLAHVPGSVRAGPNTRTRVGPVPEAIHGYHEIAKLALAQNGWALIHVHPSRADFGELARIAVQGFPRALMYVPGSRTYRKLVPGLQPRADFAELATLAMRSNKGTASYVAFSEVPADSPNYMTLWLLARRAIFPRLRGGNPLNVADTSEGWWDIDGQNDGVVRLTFPDWVPLTKFAQHAESAGMIAHIINTTPMAAFAGARGMAPGSSTVSKKKGHFI
tara:strand:- start:25 stop:1254 length:1230 start_codon:yes stop_codon:yes gene_type:complete